MLHCEPTRSPQYVASSLSLDMEYLFLVGSSGLLLMAVQQLVVILVLLQEEMFCHLEPVPHLNDRCDSAPKGLDFVLSPYMDGIFWGDV